MDNHSSALLPVGNTTSLYQSALPTSPALRATATTGTVEQKTADTVTISEAARLMAAGSENLSRQDAANFFQAAQHLESSSLPLLVSLLTEQDGESRTAFLNFLQGNGDDIEQIVTIYQDLSGEERQTFLETVNRSGRNLAVFIKTFSGLSPESRQTFLAIADRLDDKQLATFLQTAGAAGPNVNLFLETAGEFHDNKLVNFIQAAANNTGELEFLVQRVKDTEEEELSSFLLAASKSGKSIRQLDQLLSQLPDRQRLQLFAFGATLDGSQFENLLAAATLADSRVAQLFTLAGRFTGAAGTAFLAATAQAGSEIGRLLDLSQSLVNDPLLAGKVFQAAAKSGSELGTFLNMLGREDKSGTKAVLKLSVKLGEADWRNFLAAARQPGAQLGQLVSIASALEGTARSHFLFGAIQAGGRQSDYLALSSTLADQGRDDFFYLMANATADEVDGLLEQIDGEVSRGNPGFPTLLRQGGLFAEGVQLEEEYVHLENFLTDPEFEDLVQAAGHAAEEESVTRLLEQAGTAENRAGFLELAAKAGDGLTDFLDLRDRLDQLSYQDAMQLGRKLGEKQFGQFLAGLARAEEKSDAFIRQTARLPKANQDDFLQAAATAANFPGQVLKEFIDLTGQFNTSDRGKFLTVASEAGGELPRFLKATSLVLEEQKNRFLKAAQEHGYALSRLLKEDNPGHFKLSGTDPNAIPALLTPPLSPGVNLHDFLNYYLTIRRYDGS